MHFYGYSHITTDGGGLSWPLLQAQPPGYVTLMAFWMAESHITNKRGRGEGAAKWTESGKEESPLGGPRRRIRAPEIV